MPHRKMNEHKGRHRTHKTKPANRAIGALGHLITAAPAPVLNPQMPVVNAAPAIAPAVVASI